MTGQLESKGKLRVLFPVRETEEEKKGGVGENKGNGQYTVRVQMDSKLKLRV